MPSRSSAAEAAQAAMTAAVLSYSLTRWRAGRTAMAKAKAK